MHATLKTCSAAPGLAFSEEERERLYLRGLLPPAVLSQEVQAERALINIRSKSSDLERHSYLTSLQARAPRCA
jgi:malate dehydrogenase (oxaloacetate-decarboxylating)(NADP+)